MQRLKFAAFTILGSVLLLTTRCGPQPEPMSQSTPVPSGVEVVNILEKDTVTNEITQHKIFNQCDSASPFKAQIQFSQANSQKGEQELVLGAGIGGEVGVSEIAEVTIEGKLEQHFRESAIKQRGHEESVAIEVPPRTQQEYTIVWRESRREGTVQYIENGESETINYSYRIGLELTSATGRDLPCPGQEPNKMGAMPTYTPYPTHTPYPTYTPNVVPTPEPTEALPMPTPVVVIVTATSTPVPTELPFTPPGSVLAVGDTWRQGEVSLTLDKVLLNPSDLRPSFTLRNEGSQRIIGSYTTNKNIKVEDNLGIVYTVGPYYRIKRDFTLDPGESYTINGGLPYDGDLANKMVEWVLITVDDISSIQNARWKVNVYH
jgi:hypothetical protein